MQKRHKVIRGDVHCDIVFMVENSVNTVRMMGHSSNDRFPLLNGYLRFGGPLFLASNIAANRL